MISFIAFGLSSAAGSIDFSGNTFSDATSISINSAAAAEEVRTMIDMGYPKCYTTFSDVSNAYTVNLPGAQVYDENGTSITDIKSSEFQLPTTGHINMPYQGFAYTDCANVEMPLVAHVAHSSPIDVMMYQSFPIAADGSSPAGLLPSKYHGKLMMALVGSWNRGTGNDPDNQYAEFDAAGFSTGYKIDMMDIGVDGRGDLVALNREYLTKAIMPDDNYSVKVRPVDIAQDSEGRLLFSSKGTESPWGSGNYVDNGLYTVMYGVAADHFDGIDAANRPLLIEADMGNGLSMWQLKEVPCTRRISITQGGYVLLSQINSGACPEGGVKALRMSGGIVTGMVSLTSTPLDNIDGMELDSAGNLYLLSALTSTDNRGSSLMKVEGIDAIIDGIFDNGDAGIDITDTAVLQTVVQPYGQLSQWHAFGTLAITPDEKFMLAGYGANCNWGPGCNGGVHAIDLATNEIYDYVTGVRNPSGLNFIGDTLMISDMGSDRGSGIDNPAFPFHGPNDRLFAIDYFEPSVPWVPVCIDDPGVKLANAGTDCAAVVAAQTCDGIWVFAEFGMFGPVANMAVNVECPLTCGLCTA